MAKYYQDFVGLNTFVYDLSNWNEISREKINYIGTEADGVAESQNSFGIIDAETMKPAPLRQYLNYVFANGSLASFAVADNPDVFNALMIRRNGPYGYPSWKQTRISHNPLSRRQRENNVFTYIAEPGESREVPLNGGQYRTVDRYGSIKLTIEPVVMDSYKPLEMIGGINVYNEKTNKYEQKNIKIKTSFNNEMAFFANDETNRYFERILETDENYESLKELYLNGGLDDDSSPLQMFNLITYKQTVWPKQQYAYLNATRSRTKFFSKFWRDIRVDRRNTNIETVLGDEIPYQSKWPLDVQENWKDNERATPIPHSTPYVDFYYLYYIGGVMGSSASIGGETQYAFQTGFRGFSKHPSEPGGAGILMNSYAQFTRGHYITGSTVIALDAVQPAKFELPSAATVADLPLYLTSSPYYSRRHTLNRMNSVVSPSGMTITETGSLGYIQTGSLFEGMAAWDAGTQSGKNPFYDSYEDFAVNTRIKGKGYSIVPEFRISSHVETYFSKGVTEELESIFELSGALSTNTTTANYNSFYKVLSNSDFLKSFDLIKKDHEDFTKPSILTLRCKAIKKFLPYEGFYPAQQVVAIAEAFQTSVKDDVVVLSGNTVVDNNHIGIQGVMEPLFAPGVLFNTIKSGVAVDYPIILKDDNPVYMEMNIDGFQMRANASGNPAYASGAINYQLVASDLSPFQPSSYYPELNSIWSTRIDFESLVEPSRLLANLEMTRQEGHPFSATTHPKFNVSYKWGGQQKQTYKKKINNFLSEVAELFLKDKSFTTIASDEEQSPNLLGML